MNASESPEGWTPRTPVGWTVKNELNLLLLVLRQNPEISLNTRAALELWPSSTEYQPSERALGDRFNFLKHKAATMDGTIVRRSSNKRRKRVAAPTPRPPRLPPPPPPPTPRNIRPAIPTVITSMTSTTVEPFDKRPNPISTAQGSNSHKLQDRLENFDPSDLSPSTPYKRHIKSPSLRPYRSINDNESENEGQDEDEDEDEDVEMRYQDEDDDNGSGYSTDYEEFSDREPSPCLGRGKGPARPIIGQDLKNSR